MSSLSSTPLNEGSMVTVMLDFKTGETTFGIRARAVAGAVVMVKLILVSFLLLISMVPVTMKAEPENFSVTHLISVSVEEITLHLVPSDRVMLMVLPSSREGGKFVPVMVITLSPIGFKAVVG